MCNYFFINSPKLNILTTLNVTLFFLEIFHLSKTQAWLLLLFSFYYLFYSNSLLQLQALRNDLFSVNLKSFMYIPLAQFQDTNHHLNLQRMNLYRFHQTDNLFLLVPLQEKCYLLDHINLFQRRDSFLTIQMIINLNSFSFKITFCLKIITFG